MAITKRLRFVFYLLVTLEVLLLSGYYSWGRSGTSAPETGVHLSDANPYPSRWRGGLVFLQSRTCWFCRWGNAIAAKLLIDAS